MSRTTAVAFALMLVASAAWPQGRDVAAADALYREARALIKKGDYAAAYPKLEESYRLDPAAGTGINLGDCYEKLGKVGSALLAYQAALTLLGASDPRMHPVKQQIAALEKRVPRLTIKLAPGALEGTVVKRDGRTVEAAKLDSPVAVNPGKHVVIVTAPGREPARYQVTLAEGKSREVLVEAGEPVRREERPDKSVGPAARATDRQGDSLAGSSQRNIGYVVGALGAVGLTIGVASAFDWSSKHDALDKLCPDTDCRDAKTKQQYDELQDKHDSARTLTELGLGLGGAALAGGVVLVLLAPSRAPASTSRAPASTSRAPASTSLHAAPRLSLGSYGFQFGGMW